MGSEMLITVVTLIAAIVLFSTEWLPFDVTALALLATLMVGGVLTPAEALSGFSNQATITIAAMFVLSEGIRRTGLLERAATRIASAGGGSYRFTALTLMGGIALLSAFINNTAAVAIFIPATLQIARKLDVAPTRLLMPLSFAAMFGGVCTLIGTSTNLLVSSLAVDHGLEPFGMFEFAPIGLLLLGIGFAYLLTVGVRLFPDRPRDDATRRFGLGEYLTHVRIGERAADVGVPLRQATIVRDLDLNVVQVLRDGQALPHASVVLAAGDVLRVRGDLTAIQRLLEREQLELLPGLKARTPVRPSADERIVEGVISADSPWVSERLHEADLEQRYGARLLGVRHHGRLVGAQEGGITLSGGDTLLLIVPADRLRELERDRPLVLLSRGEPQRLHPLRAAWAVGLVAAAVIAAAADLAPIVVSALAASVLMVLSRCVSVEGAYEAINWKVVMLLAGVLPLGIAIERSGLAAVAGDGLLLVAGRWGPSVVLAAVVLGALLLTNVMSNQATAVLLAPIALRSAQSLEVDPRPLLVGLTVAASLSFMSPVGYQTNTMIYGAGNYRFLDFVKVGTPLNLLLWLAATALVPLFWPF